MSPIEEAGDQLTPPGGLNLRAMQQEAFRLLRFRFGFLWGPPGTGKTYTLSALLATYIREFPERHVLLVANTNTAVDQAIISVDKRVALPGGHNDLEGAYLRVGSGWNAAGFLDHGHLLLRIEEEILRRLADLDVDPRGREPDNPANYAEWKTERHNLRRQIADEVMERILNSRLVAMTSTLATFLFAPGGDHDFLHYFDLVVIDEGSVVSLGHAAMLTQFGKQAIVAGDPKQLGPIVRSESDVALKWLGKSVFELMNDNTVFLNEQQRMAPGICRLVSRMFYNERLVVAADLGPDWAEERQLADVPELGRSDVFVSAGVGWATQDQGSWKRELTALRVVGLVEGLLTSASPVTGSEILVLTPFRAQRRLIRQLLNNHPEVKVSTVHRAQASEAHTVIFDPVKGDSRFLTEGNADYIINVALSRAKARLIVVLAPQDLENPRIQQICWTVDGNVGGPEAMPPAQAEPPADQLLLTVGQVVNLDGYRATIAEIDEDNNRVKLFMDGNPPRKVARTLAWLRQRLGVGNEQPARFGVDLAHEYAASAVGQCVSQGIRREEIEDVLRSGDMLEELVADRHGFVLIRGRTGDGRLLHLQCAVSSRPIVKIVRAWVDR